MEFKFDNEENENAFELKEINENLKKLPKLKGDFQSYEKYLKIIEEYYHLSCSKKEFFDKNGINLYQFDKIESFMKKYFPIQLEDALLRRKNKEKEKTQYHILNMPIIIEQISENKLDISRFLTGELDIECLIKVTSESVEYKKYLKKFHTLRIELKKYKAPFEEKAYLAMNVEIAGIKVTKEDLEKTLKYMNKNSIFICNYTVQEEIRKRILKRKK
jgi:hypothetical protein